MDTNTGISCSYLSFKLGAEEFATNVEKVLSIIELTNITEVPKAPEYMKGVINLRGTVLPIIDTRIKFGMTPTVYTTDTCIIVLEIEMNNETIKVGALVDSVQAVLEIENSHIKPAPTIGNRYKTEFITGIVSVEDKFIMILSMDALFSSEKISIEQNITEEVVSSVE